MSIRACAWITPALLALTAVDCHALLELETLTSSVSGAVFATSPPGDTERFFVVEQAGRIRIVDLATGQVNASAFLDIDALVGSGGERGLLGLAFHPDYDSTGWFFVNYTNNSGDTVVARYSVGPDPDLADAGSALVLKTYDQPYSNHNGGWIGFGPDGMLYVSLGDGGSANDPGNRALNLNNPMGKMMRLDVDGAAPWVPADNPFIGQSVYEEIWAYGLRNAWRCSFDRLTGDLWMADVGQNAWEEISFQPAASAGGENYGWACREGFVCTGLHSCGSCNGFQSVDPVHVYNHSGGRCSITGGYVYRGSIGAIQGEYFFADYCSHDVYSLSWDGNTATVTDRTSELDPFSTILSFAEDENGELYILTGGTVYRIVSDECGSGGDCNENGTPDDCDIQEGTSEDCNGNGIPDECDIADGTSLDANLDGIPDECVDVGANDCENAPWILSGDWTFDTSTATTDGVAHASCQFDGQCYNDIWMKWLAPCTGTLEITLCGSGYDTDLVVYEGADCPFDDADLVGCNDDGCPGSGSPSWRSQLSVAVEQGTTYTIRIGGWGESSAGEGVLSLSCDGVVGCGNGIDCNSNGEWDDCDIEAGTSQDCNENGIPDECDIASGSSLDTDQNGVPDECEVPGFWTSEHFVSGTACAQCHNQGEGIYDDGGEDSSPFESWQATMMANSARDPYWRAKVQVEIDQFASEALREQLQQICLQCHAPMGVLESQFAGESDYLLSDLAGDPPGLEGVSCTLCHQQEPIDPMDPLNWSGQFTVNTEQQIYGPFNDVTTPNMEDVTGYAPAYGEHLGESSACVSCHTLLTPSLDASGTQVGVFPEQVPWLEQLNSDFAAETCQSCHMAERPDARPISTIPSGLTPRAPRADHAVVGGNTVMLRLMAANTEALNTLADSADFAAMAEKSAAFLQTAAQLEAWREDSLLAVQVRNLTGHKLPTGIPVRRLWLEVQAFDAAEQTVFHSGAPLADGTIAGQDGSVEPHHALIVDEADVQVWEGRMEDDTGTPTWSLLRANGWAKDNRLLPAGWSASGPWVSLTAPVGDCVTDSSYHAADSGADRTRYHLPESAVRAEVRLLFQGVNPRVVQAMEGSTHPEVLEFLAMWNANDPAPELVASATVYLGEMPELLIDRSASNILLSWEGGEELEVLRRVEGGAWTTLGLQSSPFTDSGAVGLYHLAEYRLQRP